MTEAAIKALEAKGLRIIISTYPKRTIRLKKDLITELGESDAYFMADFVQKCADRLAAPTVVDWFENDHMARMRWYNEHGRNAFPFDYRLNLLRGNSYLSFLLYLDVLKKQLVCVGFARATLLWLSLSFQEY